MSTKYKVAIANITEKILREKRQSVLYGLGVTDSVGIFGTTLGLEKKFSSERVFDVPISEESMLGFAVGLSLQGIYPINVHIRNDFLLLAMNQLVNTIAKYRSMYGGQFKVPMLIRAVIGRSWGQGAQHSQSLQSLFSHIPGLTVIMPSSPSSIEASYWEAVNSYPGPVISLEHRYLYDYEFSSSVQQGLLGSHIVEQGDDITVIASSYMVQEFQKISPFLKSHGISIELIDIHCLTHPNKDLIFHSLEKTKKLIVGDTSWAPFGLAAEISRWILEKNPSLLAAPMKNLTLAATPCPTSKSLEKLFYPNLENMIMACFELKFGKKNFTPPSFYSEIEEKQKFKGPF